MSAADGSNGGSRTHKGGKGTTRGRVGVGQGSPVLHVQSMTTARLQLVTMATPHHVIMCEDIPEVLQDPAL